MIDISFVNLILIIADNAFDSREFSNPYSSTPGAPGSSRHSVPLTPSSPHSSTPVVFGSPRLSAPVKSSNPSNSMPSFLVDILTNPFGNFSVDASSNLIVDSTPSLAVPSFSNLPVLSQFLRDDFPALATNALFALGWDILPNYFPSTGCPLLPLFSPSGNL